MSKVEKLLSIVQAARIIGVKPDTITSWTAKGALPHVRILAGRKRPAIRFREPDLDAFVCDRIAQGRLIREEE